MTEERVNWPAWVPQPELPVGYEWVVLRPALGLGSNGDHPWWVRVQWKTRNGRKRYLPLNEEYFGTPQAAIEYAVESARAHASRRVR